MPRALAQCGRPVSFWPRPGEPSSHLPSIAAVPSLETPVQQRPGEVLLWTDGACRVNPGPGGWAAIVVSEHGATSELYGNSPATTNNRMEFTAALEGLRALPANSSVCVVTDSRLMLDSMTKWIHGWRRRGW